MRFWISWYETSEDHRPLTYPPNQAVLGWWCSGYRCFDNAAAICALVEAESEEEAENAILQDWPGEKEWRFLSQVEKDYDLGDRFPLSDWMKERIK